MAANIIIYLEALVHSCSVKKVFKLPPVPKSFLNKVAGLNLRLTASLKKESGTDVFL